MGSELGIMACGEGKSRHDSDALNSGDFYRNSGVSNLPMERGRVIWRFASGRGCCRWERRRR
jgi:hypothetical protein